MGNLFLLRALITGLLSEIILLGSPYNFHTLSLNSLASPSADIFSIVGMK